jgi:hypothetical protein
MHQVSKERPALPAPQLRSRRDRRAARARVIVQDLMMPDVEVARAEARPRETVTAFLRRTGWATHDRTYGWQFHKGLPTTILEINGECVLRKDWRRQRISVGAEVRFVSYPLGGGGSGGSAGDAQIDIFDDSGTSLDGFDDDYDEIDLSDPS